MVEPAKRVLVIDDDESILRMYCDALTDNGFETVSETTSPAALNRLLKREHFDLVITDICLAEMDGWTLLDTIREDLNLDELKLPVIVVSAYDSSEMELNSLAHKANSWLVKPIVPIARLVKVAETFTGGRTDDHDAD